MVRKLNFGTTILVFIFSSILAFSAYGQEDIDVKNLKGVDIDALSEEQILKFSQEVKKRGLTPQQLEILAKSRGASDYQISRLKQRLANIDLTEQQQSSTEDLSRLRNEVVLPENEPLDQDPFTNLFLEDEDADEVKIFGMDFFNNPKLSFEPSLNIPTPLNYQLGAGDQLLVDVWGASEQNYQLMISPEGSIFIPSLGPINVQGLTVEQASRRIRSKLKVIYSGIGSNTFVQVSLGQNRTMKIHVVGEVVMPGTYTVSSFASVFNVLYYAGGPSENGSLRTIDVFRGGNIVGSTDIYKFLTGQNEPFIPLSDQDIIIVRPYIGRVLVEGEIKRPGFYEVKPDESINELLKLAGGFSDQAYSQNIRIKRNNDLLKSVFTVSEEQYDEFKLQGGDELYITQIIERFENRVQILGAVNKEGEYELIEGMSLKELIAKAEGLRRDAFLGRGILIRMDDDLSMTNIPFDLNKVVSGEGDIILQNEDFIRIQSVNDLKEESYISLQGEVNEPGKYPFIDSLTVEDIIYLAKGFKESAARSFVEVARRNDQENTTDAATASILFSFPVSKDLSISSEASTFKLMPYDLVIVRKSPFYSEQEIVEVEGEVNFPGKYSLEKRNERISDLLKRAGGITKFSYVEGATLIRRTEYYVDEEDDAEAAKLRRENLERLSVRDSLDVDENFEIKQQESIGIDLPSIIQEPGSKYDLILNEGDILSIPRKLETVRLRGELFYPATVRFERNLSFRDYISQAGGFSDRANKRKAYAIYANGSGQRTKSFLWFSFFPKVEPGTEIIVPKKPVKRTVTSSEIVGLATGIATLGLVTLRVLDVLDNSSSSN